MPAGHPSYEEMRKKLIPVLALLAAVGVGASVAKATSQDLPNTQTTEVTATTDTVPAGPTLDIETTAGPIKIRLYDDTPQHRDNFLRLAREGVYDGVLFHRVINDFMVQTGDPNSKDAPAGKMLGDGDMDYTIPAEIIYPKHYHKYGALAAARTGDNVNPEFRSSGSQFYIVTGRKFSEAQLRQMEQGKAQKELQAYFMKLQRDNKDKIMELRAAKDSVGLENLRQELIKETEANVHPQGMTPEQIRDYTTIGGTPHLDGTYTVFGEVLEGMDTVEKIQKAETDGNDRPKEDIRIISVKVEE